MSEQMAAVHLGPGEGERVTNPVGGDITFKVRGAESGGALAVFETLVAPGDGPPLHVHAAEEEAWYALSGEFRFRLGDIVHAAPAGSFVFIPRGLSHCFQNIGDAPGRALAVFTPAGMERFFESFGAVGGGATPETFRRLGAEVGMEVVGPPLARSHP